MLIIDIQKLTKIILFNLHHLKKTLKLGKVCGNTNKNGSVIIIEKFEITYP